LAAACFPFSSANWITFNLKEKLYLCLGEGALIRRNTVYVLLFGKISDKNMQGMLK
jgi:hypothetical protein